MYIILNEEDAAAAKEKLNAYDNTIGYPHSSRLYGIWKSIRDFYRLPQNYRMDNWEIFHGVPIDDQYQHLHMCECPILTMNESEEKSYRTNGKNATTIGSPFVMARKANGIDLAEDAAGTIAFPSHSNIGDRIICDWDELADALLNLPEAMQPVSVCLYYKEIMDGAYEPFLRRKIPVYCAGHIEDDNFPINFYNILRRFKYATSNSLGSMLFYAVEMGVPFFFYGNDASYEIMEKYCEDYPEGVFSAEDQAPIATVNNYYKKLFAYKGTLPVITPEMKNIVETKLGVKYIYNGPSPAKRSMLIKRFRRLQLGNTLRKFKVIK